jgi:hypothetical protein
VQCCLHIVHFSFICWGGVDKYILCLRFAQQKYSSIYIVSDVRLHARKFENFETLEMFEDIDTGALHLQCIWVPFLHIAMTTRFNAIIPFWRF